MGGYFGFGSCDGELIDVFWSLLFFILFEYSGIDVAKEDKDGYQNSIRRQKNFSVSLIPKSKPKKKHGEGKQK